MINVNVTYGFVIGSILIFVDSTTNVKDEKFLLPYINSETKSLIQSKIEGGLDDDDNFLAMNFDNNVKERMERIMKRSVNTIAKKYDVDYKLGILLVE